MSPFASPPDPFLFKNQVWEIVRLVPPGKVTTYGQIAKMLPPPGDMPLRSYEAFGPRWVGGAMAACPEDVPWQRVINSKGEVSPRPGAYEQRRLLEEEGVVFDDRGRVSLKVYLWQGPPADWRREHQLNPPNPSQTGLI
jgi:methylated-DNA-protein-cysteine methyltransferase-like protein